MENQFIKSNKPHFPISITKISKKSHSKVICFNLSSIGKNENKKIYIGRYNKV